MMIENLHEDDFDEIPGQEAAWLDREPPELEWDEGDESMAVDELLGGSQRYSRDYA